MNKSEEAVKYILNRIQIDPDLRYYAGFGTETFHKLCAAESEVDQIPFADVEEKRNRDLQPKYNKRIPRVKELEIQVKTLEDQCCAYDHNLMPAKFRIWLEKLREAAIRDKLPNYYIEAIDSALDGEKPPEHPIGFYHKDYSYA